MRRTFFKSGAIFLTAPKATAAVLMGGEARVPESNEGKATESIWCSSAKISALM